MTALRLKSIGARSPLCGTRGDAGGCGGCGGMLCGSRTKRRGGVGGLFLGGMELGMDLSVLRELEHPSRETGGFKLCR